MNFTGFRGGITHPGRSGAVARSTARRRLAAGSVALAAVVASLAFTTAPAHASGTGFCLDANAKQAFDLGQVMQWQCSPSDPYQNWVSTIVADPPGVGLLIQFKNEGTGECLDADAGDVGDYGAIIQYGCNASDPYQLWMLKSDANGDATIYEWENYGVYSQYQGAAYCLDADAGDVGDFGVVMQWKCDPSDPYQQWDQPYFDSVPNVLGNVGTGA